MFPSACSHCCFRQKNSGQKRRRKRLALFTCCSAIQISPEYGTRYHTVSNNRKCSVPSSHFPDFSAVTNRDSLPPGSLRFRVRRSAGECRTGPSEGRKTLSGPLDSPLSFGLFCYFPFGGFIITAIRLFVNRFLILF